MSDDEIDNNINGNNNIDSSERGGTVLSHLNWYFDALSDRRRRHALYYLNDHRGESVSVSTVARHVKALETEYSPDTLVEEDFADVLHELYHDHLPRLADYGIVDYDSRSGEVQFDRSSRGLMMLLWMSHFLERSS